MRHWLIAVVIGTVAPGLAVGSAALAQTKAKAADAPAGAFERLSLGNQKVAASLYETQNAGRPEPGSTGTTPTARPLTLGEIAARRQAGQGWGQVFRDMQAQGLVREKSLGQVVVKYGQSTRPGHVENASGNGNGKADAFGAGSNGSADGESHGNGKGAK